MPPGTEPAAGISLEHEHGAGSSQGIQGGSPPPSPANQCPTIGRGVGYNSKVTTSTFEFDWYSTSCPLPPCVWDPEPEQPKEQRDGARARRQQSRRQQSGHGNSPPMSDQPPTEDLPPPESVQLPPPPDQLPPPPDQLPPKSLASGLQPPTLPSVTCLSLEGQGRTILRAKRLPCLTKIPTISPYLIRVESRGMHIIIQPVILFSIGQKV